MTAARTREDTGGLHQPLAQLTARPAAGAALARAHLEARGPYRDPGAARCTWWNDPVVLGRVRDALAPGGTAMGGTAPPGGTGIQDDLDFLRHHWGDAYLISTEGPLFVATRRDGRGATLADFDRDGLLGRIQADYIADPVSRDLP